jgi:hypothetical protein
MIHHLIFLIIQSVTGSVTIHNIRTVAPCYRELLAYWFILHGSLGAVWRALRWWQLSGGGGVGGGSVAAAASLAAEAAAWRKQDFDGDGSASGNAAAARWRQRQRQCSIGSGSGSSAVAGSLVMVLAAWQQQLGGSMATAVAAEVRQQLGRGGRLGNKNNARTNRGTTKVYFDQTEGK